MAVGRALGAPHTSPPPLGFGNASGARCPPGRAGTVPSHGSRSSSMACSRRGGLEPGSWRGRAPRPREASLGSGPRGRPRGRQPAWVRDVARGSAQCPSAARAPLGLSPLQGGRLPARPGQGRGAPTGESHPAAHGRAPRSRRRCPSRPVASGHSATKPTPKGQRSTPPAERIGHHQRDPSRAARAEQVRVRASYLCAVTCSPAVKEHEVIRPEVSEIPAFSLGNPFLIIEARSYL